MLRIRVIKISDFRVSLKIDGKQLKVIKLNKTNRTNAAKLKTFQGVISGELCIHVLYKGFILDSRK